MLALDLSGKKALVTGSTGGIGLAIATRLAEAGAHVIVNGRGEERTSAAIETIRKGIPQASLTGFAGDVAKPKIIATLVESHPDIDVLVNNLGIFEEVPFGEISDEEWLRFFEINVMSGVRLSRAYLPGMVERKNGRIVFISSESGLNIPAEMIHYGFSKAAQIAIARGLAESVAGSGVTINSVLPGPTRTEGVMSMIEKAAGKSGRSPQEVEASFLKENRPTTLINRLADPEEVANMVAYVCSPLASATSGAALRVEGGLLRHPG
ncbi:oxidoreductase [Asaia sp. W19]|uniref:SDR family NAD(P)-dependent oxidoreductase n=1 Tax=unclassified Asaia TaxID=2685023 RepID=UPI000F8E67CC|nr:SDR family oxidoreductase [Asaia sp. W19]RUT25649.1 oxidoreductase [Asaia sp. W19]